MKYLILLVICFFSSLSYAQPTRECDENQEVFVVVEEMPKFPGGEQAMYKFLGTNIKYPADARSQLIQGKVFVGFVVDNEGYICSPKIARGVSPSLDAEALRVVSSMPQWEPGKQIGKPVSVKFTIPIHFSLGDSYLAREWYDEEWNACKKTEAAYYRDQILIERGGVFVRDHYLDGTPYKEGVYAEKKLATELGTFTWYHPNGEVKKLVDYNFGEIVPNSIRNFDEQGNEVDLVQVYETMPEFPGGEMAMYRWLAKEIRMPKDENGNALSGKVYVRFFVDEKGNVHSEELLRAPHEKLGEEALRVVKKMPNWKPATQDGKTVSIQFTLPIIFQKN